MATFQRRLVISRKELEQLKQLYQGVLTKAIATIENQSDFGRASRAQVIHQIESILNGYSVDVRAHIAQELPKQYQDAAAKAIADLQGSGANLTVLQTFNSIDQDAVAALIDEASQQFGTAIQGVYKNMTLLMTGAQKDYIKARISEGLITGETTKSIRDDVVNQLRDQGLGSLTDASGKTWSLDSYTDMLVRTKAAEAHNTGISNKMLQNGFDLVQVTDTGSTHQACADWEGKVLSLSGDTSNPIVEGTVDEAEAAGLFHPNCEHALVPYTEGLSDQIDAATADDNTSDQG